MTLLGLDFKSMPIPHSAFEPRRLFHNDHSWSLLPLAMLVNGSASPSLVFRLCYWTLDFKMAVSTPKRREEKVSLKSHLAQLQLPIGWSKVRMYLAPSTKGRDWGSKKGLNPSCFLFPDSLLYGAHGGPNMNRSSTSSFSPSSGVN